MATLIFLQRAVRHRCLNALRLFYFAVHPDFFGQYLREREVNENHGCSSSVDQIVSAAVQLSQPTVAGRLAEGEDQPSPGWNSSDPHGQAGTSPAHH